MASRVVGEGGGVVVREAIALAQKMVLSEAWPVASSVRERTSWYVEIIALAR
jgi:hypothetical protein